MMELPSLSRRSASKHSWTVLRRHFSLVSQAQRLHVLDDEDGDDEEALKRRIMLAARMDNEEDRMDPLVHLAFAHCGLLGDASSPKKAHSDGLSAYSRLVVSLVSTAMSGSSDDVRCSTATLPNVGHFRSDDDLRVAARLFSSFATSLRIKKALKKKHKSWLVKLCSSLTIPMEMEGSTAPTVSRERMEVAHAPSLSAGELGHLLRAASNTNEWSCASLARLVNDVVEQRGRMVAAAPPLFVRARWDAGDVGALLGCASMARSSKRDVVHYSNVLSQVHKSTFHSNHVVAMARAGDDDGDDEDDDDHQVIVGCDARTPSWVHRRAQHQHPHHRPTPRASTSPTAAHWLSRDAALFTGHALACYADQWAAVDFGVVLCDAGKKIVHTISNQGTLSIPREHYVRYLANSIIAYTACTGGKRDRPVIERMLKEHAQDMTSKELEQVVALLDEAMPRGLIPAIRRWVRWMVPTPPRKK